MSRNRLYFAIVAIILLVAINRINRMNKEIETKKEQSSSELNCPGDIDCDSIPDEEDRFVTESPTRPIDDEPYRLSLRDADLSQWATYTDWTKSQTVHPRDITWSTANACESIHNDTDEYVFVGIEGVTFYFNPNTGNEVKNEALVGPGDRLFHCAGRNGPVTCKVARLSSRAERPTWTNRGYLWVEPIEEVRCSIEGNDRGDRSICIQPPDGFPPRKETHCGYRSSP